MEQRRIKSNNALINLSLSAIILIGVISVVIAHQAYGLWKADVQERAPLISNLSRVETHVSHAILALNTAPLSYPQRYLDLARQRFDSAAVVVSRCITGTGDLDGFAARVPEDTVTQRMLRELHAAIIQARGQVESRQVWEMPEGPECSVTFQGTYRRLEAQRAAIVDHLQQSTLARVQRYRTVGGFVLAGWILFLVSLFVLMILAKRRHRRIEREFQQSEVRYRLLFQRAPLGILTVDRDGLLRDFNHAVARLLGVKSDEQLVDVNLLEFEPLKGTGFATDFERCLCSKRSVVSECDFTTRDDRRVHLWYHMVPIADHRGEVSGAQMIVEDFTSRKQYEDRLRENEEKFQLISEQSLLGICILQKQRVAYCNRSFSTLVEVSEEEASGWSVQDIFDSIHEDDREFVVEQARRKMTGARDVVVRYPFRLRLKSGKVKHCELYSKSVMYEGSPADLVTVIDVSDRVRLENAQRQMAEQYRAVTENSTDLIVRLDRNLRHVYVNNAAAAALDLTPPNVIGKTQRELNLPDNVIEQTERAANLVFRTALQQKMEVSWESRNGSVSLDVSLVPEKSANGQVETVLCTFRDVTELKRLQEFSARAQRLETAGRIAGQVAHDFNNLLGPLMAYPELMRPHVGDDNKVTRFLDAMEKSARQMSDINQQLLTLGRRGHYTLSPLDINSIVKQVVDAVRTESRELTIRTDLAPDLLPIKGGNSQIFRMLSNLVTNAADAIEQRGKISVSTENFYVEAASGTLERIPQGEYVKVSIIDTGVGIPPEDMARIFEPFFSTKSANKKRGSGLGLSIVHAVMEDHRGFIDVASTVGEGTAFYLYFPITRERIEDEDDDVDLRGGSETIMVVDDDSTQREVTTALLDQLGYRVVVADSGEQCMNMLRDSRPDLVLLDMLMPGGIDGTETYRRASQVHPGLAAVIVSGYAETSKVEEALELGAHSFLRKPLTLNSIARAVRAALDEAPVAVGAES